MPPRDVPRPMLLIQPLESRIIDLISNKLMAHSWAENDMHEDKSPLDKLHSFVNHR